MKQMVLEKPGTSSVEFDPYHVPKSLHTNDADYVHIAKRRAQVYHLSSGCRRFEQCVLENIVYQTSREPLEHMSTKLCDLEQQNLILNALCCFLFPLIVARLFFNM